MLLRPIDTIANNPAFKMCETTGRIDMRIPQTQAAELLPELLKFTEQVDQESIHSRTINYEPHPCNDE